MNSAVFIPNNFKVTKENIYCVVQTIPALSIYVHTVVYIVHTLEHISNIIQLYQPTLLDKTVQNKN